jgi:hypothetical protein
MRPGSVIGEQQHFLAVVERELLVEQSASAPTRSPTRSEPVGAAFGPANQSLGLGTESVDLRCFAAVELHRFGHSGVAARSPRGA